MNLQSGQASELSARKSRADFGLDTCPTCGQEIPPDKLEEISGKIAAREREQMLAITAQLEKQYASERTRRGHQGKGRPGIGAPAGRVRETRARDEAQKAAEKLISEKQAEAERSRVELVAGWQQQLGRGGIRRRNRPSKCGRICRQR